MKKNNIIYTILLTLIVLFSNSINVMAEEAKELTCLYKDGKKQLVLMQDKQANKSIYTNENGATLETSSGKMWEKQYNAEIKFAYNKIRDVTNYLLEDLKEKDMGVLGEDAILIACPKSVDSLSGDDYSFFGEENININLEKQYEKRIRLETIEVGEITKNINRPDSSCSDMGDDVWLSDFDEGLYTGSCLYRSNIAGSNCHVIQVDFGAEMVKITEFDPIKGIKYSSLSSGKTSDNVKVSFEISDNFKASTIISNAGGSCLPMIKVDRKTQGTMSGWPKPTPKLLSISTDVYFSSDKGDGYVLFNVRGKNSKTGDFLSLDIEENLLNFEIVEIENCEELLGPYLYEKLKVVWNLVRIGVPIILIVLGIIDFAKAIFAGSEDNMKKSQKRFMTRVIIAITIFLVPSVLSLLLQIANSIWGNIGTDICGILG